MTENPDLNLADLNKSGLWGYNATSGKWKPAKVNDAGELVTTTAGGGGGGLSQADKSAFVEGTGLITPVGGVVNDTISADPGEDTAAAMRLTTKRGLHVNLRNVGGTEIGTNANPVQVGDAGGTLSVDDGAGSLTVDGTVGISGTVDVSDRAARLVGVTYGSQAQQLKQTATNFNLAVENHVGGTAIDPRDVSDRAARLLGKVGFKGASRTTLTINAAAPQNGTAADVSDATTVLVDLTGATFAGVGFKCQGSVDGGTTWLDLLPMSRVDTPLIERNPTALGNAQAPRGWTVNVASFTSFRVVSSAWTSGSAVVGYTPSAAPLPPAQNLAPISIADPTTPSQIAQVNASNMLVVRALLRNTANGDISGQATSPAGTENFMNTWGRPMPATLGVTATAAAGTGVTATLAAAGAGLFHYITRITVSLFVSAALTGAATVQSITSTNLPVSPLFDVRKILTGQNAVGDMAAFVDQDFGSAPIKSSVANTASTVVAPAFTGAIWRITVYYYTGN